jgi:pantoate--beta-alanine ligase
MQIAADEVRRQGKRIGVVPTMGYFHEGHLSLIKIVRPRVDVVVTTIFVNPMQFAPTEDFTRYPRDLKRDTMLAESAGTDILFVPEAKEMYHGSFQTHIEVERLTKTLEGVSRPAHFRGVVTVVGKLFNITKPNVAVFGQKDAQQAVVIRRMAADLNFDIEIVVAPIIREPDGLAMSSRNVYLSKSEREDALTLNKSLKLAERLVGNGERDAQIIIEQMRKLIGAAPSAQIDYVAVSDAETLEDVQKLALGDNVLVSLAVRIGKTRLIDNCVLTIR